MPKYRKFTALMKSEMPLRFANAGCGRRGQATGETEEPCDFDRRPLRRAEAGVPVGIALRESAGDG